MRRARQRLVRATHSGRREVQLVRRRPRLRPQFAPVLRRHGGDGRRTPPTAQCGLQLWLLRRLGPSFAAGTAGTAALTTRTALAAPVALAAPRTPWVGVGSAAYVPGASDLSRRVPVRGRPRRLHQQPAGRLRLQPDGLPHRRSGRRVPARAREELCRCGPRRLSAEARHAARAHWNGAA